MFNKISLSRGSIASLSAIFVGAGGGGGNTPAEVCLIKYRFHVDQ